MVQPSAGTSPPGWLCWHGRTLKAPAESSLAFDGRAWLPLSLAPLTPFGGGHAVIPAQTAYLSAGWPQALGAASSVTARLCPQHRDLLLPAGGSWYKSVEQVSREWLGSSVDPGSWCVVS